MTDRYTKAVLTIIATTLVVIAVQNTGLVYENRAIVRGGVAVYSYGALPVNVKNEDFAVRVTNSPSVSVNNDPHVHIADDEELKVKINNDMFHPLFTARSY